MTLRPINPLEYITDRDPIPEAVMDSSAWFKTETIEINVGEWSGRPTKEIMLRTSMLNYYFANGWYISEVLDSKEGGRWITAATARAFNRAHSDSRADSTSQSDGNSRTTPAATQTQYPSKTTQYPPTMSTTVVTSPGSTTNYPATKASTTVTTPATTVNYPTTTSTSTSKTSATVPGGGSAGAQTSTTDTTTTTTTPGYSITNPTTSTTTDTSHDPYSVTTPGSATTTTTTNGGYSVTTPAQTVTTRPTSEGRGESKSNGSTRSNGSSNSTSDSESNVTTDGAPWWYAYQRLRLKRRKMQSELVLKDMIASFTKAYNEGRKINDERYDELVALYSIMLSRTEDEANAFAGLNADDFKPLADAVVAACKDAMEKYGAAADNIPDDWMQSRVDEINRKFDAMISKARTELVDKGLYNSTVWPTTESGIERDRQIALNNLKDTMVTMKVDVYGKIATMKADIGQKLLDCEIRIIEAQQKMLLGPTEVRNTVFKWMLEFMERREDDYPGLDQLATIAEKLGYAEGSFAGAEAK